MVQNAEFIDLVQDGVGETTTQIEYKVRCVCVCVCVCCHPIYSGRQVCGPTSRGHTGFLIHLPSAVLALVFVARRNQPSLSLVDREVESCVPTNQSLSTCWA